MVGRGNISDNNSTRNSDKRKERDCFESRSRKKKTFGIGVQIFSEWDQLLESISTKSDCTSLHMDQKGDSILKVMVELHSIPEMSIDDDFHDFIAEHLSLRRKKKCGIV